MLKIHERRRECMKKTISVLLALLVVLPILVVCLSVPISAESLYIHKVVSVVYDDSYSMQQGGSLNYRYASYAMQSFCGMLNSEDQLYITYMSKQFETQKIDLSAEGIQASVDAIKNHPHNGNTPYDAVKTAYSKLKSVKATASDDENTQYWLVVITDGEFNELSKMNSKNEKIAFLDDNLNGYVSQFQEDFGTDLQITYMGIGDVTMPTENPEKGIYTYQASGSGNDSDDDEIKTIESTMAEIADKISGRTRLTPKASEDDKNGDYYYAKGSKRAISVSSTIPLLNIAVFSQGTNATIAGVTHNGDNVPISRSATLGVSDDLSMVGGAFLIGDSQQAMGSGEYIITFDKEIDLKNVVILFEPALEVRVNVKVNGKAINDLTQLDNIMAKDKISITYSLYEMGTNNEIDLGILPSGTTYEINVYEENKLVKTCQGQGEMLTDFELDEKETKITAAITIAGFSPIDFTLKFTPTKYVPKINYTIEPSLGSDVECVLKEDVSENKDLQVCFTVFADGVKMTNVDEVKALNPVIKTSVQGNDGEVTYTNDGKIVFTPKSASARPGNEAVFDVKVTCTIKDGTSASQKYKVDASIFEAVFVGPGKTIKKTELHGNTIAATFYLTKEGVKMNKSEVGESFTYTLNKSRKDLQTRVSVSDDGMITITPSSKEEHKKSFFLFYWWDYANLNGSDITITFNHKYASAEGTLDVVGGGGAYVFFNVLLWLGIEALIALILAAYIIRILTKTRFNSKAKLYKGILTRQSNGSYDMEITGVVSMKNGNKLTNASLWNPFKPLEYEDFYAMGGGVLRSKKPFFEHRIEPIAYMSSRPSAEMLFENYKNTPLVINTVSCKELMKEQAISSDNKTFFFVPIDPKNPKPQDEIQMASFFCYVIEEKKK